MRKKAVKLGIWMVLGSIVAAACASLPGRSEASQVELPATSASPQGVIAEGIITPNQTLELSFAASGIVAEVLVKEGDFVGAGDVIARLETPEALLAEVARAEKELLDAQQARDRLLENAGNEAAAALQEIANVYNLIRDTKINLDNLTLPYDQRNLEATEAAALASSQLDVARKNYEPCKNKRESEWTSKEKTVCKDLQEKLEDARSYYRTAVRRIQYESELMVANAKLEDLLADYQNLQQGPDPDELKAIEARIKADEAALVQANAALDDLVVRAPFDGTVVNLDLIIGERIVAGQAFAELADFSRWYVETDNLTELEVVKITAGQAVLITPDALPELKLGGTVERISNVFEEKRGDITYTARIILNDEDPRLRWGMTVLVAFINP